MAEQDRRTRFEALFLATYEPVLAYVLRRASAADADDVVAETYAVAWRRLEDVPPDPLPWVYGVARRTLANSRRSSRRRVRLAARLAGESLSRTIVEPDPADRVGEQALMRAALAALSDSDREILMLIAWEGLDNERASAALGIRPQTFAVRLHRARNRLEVQIRRLSGAPQGSIEDER